MERWPLIAAPMSAVQPRLVCRLTLAPRISSSLTVSRWSSAAAACSRAKVVGRSSVVIPEHSASASPSLRSHYLDHLLQLASLRRPVDLDGKRGGRAHRGLGVDRSVSLARRIRVGPPASVQPPCAPPLPCVGRREDKQQSAATARPATRRAGRVGSAAHAGCDLKGAVIWRRFWRPAAARTGTCGQPLFSAAKGVQILKWRQMRAFSGSLTEWCGRAVAARLLPQQPPSGRFLPGSCPAPARLLLLPGSCPVPARFLPGCCPPGSFLPDTLHYPCHYPLLRPTARGSIRPPRSGGCCAGARQQPAAPQKKPVSPRYLFTLCGV